MDGRWFWICFLFGLMIILVLWKSQAGTNNNASKDIKRAKKCRPDVSARN